METTVYLVRHCEATGNADGTVQGITDNEITEKGKRQLELLAERFAPIPLDCVYSSPLKRAVATAEAANRHHQVPIQIEPALLEISFGRFEKRIWAEVLQEHPEFGATWDTHMWDLCPPEGEPMRHVYARMAKAFESCVARSAGKTILLSGHGCAFRNLLCFLNGGPIEQIYEIPWLDNTSVSCVRVAEGGRITKVFFGDASHLQPEMTGKPLQIV